MTSLQKWGKSVRTTIPVMAGYLVLGAGFGILLRTRGYGLGWALAMSAFIYAGSMQYVAIDLLTGGASLLTTAVTTLLVNARHLFYGISMLERYRAAGKYAPYLIFSLTDETYSLVAAREDLTGAECFRISLLDQLYWVLGTALGSLAGAYLDFNTTGIDFSLTALFLTVFTEQWLETKDHAPAHRSRRFDRLPSSVRRGQLPAADDGRHALLPFGARRAPDEEGRRERMNTHAVLLIAVSALVTALIRFAPFLVFRGGRETPAVILRLGKLLPCAVMSMLVVYCLRNMNFVGASHALPEIIAAAVVVLLHVWRRNTLLSIVAGTVVYMLLVQLVFV